MDLLDLLPDDQKPQGHPDRSRARADGYRRVAGLLDRIRTYSQAAIDGVAAAGPGPEFENFFTFWQEMLGDRGFLAFANDLSMDLARGYKGYADAVDDCRQALRVRAAPLVASDAGLAAAVPGVDRMFAQVISDFEATVAAIIPRSLAGRERSNLRMALGQGISYPLRTIGSEIVDAAGRPVHLASVSWYGTESQDFAVGGLQAASIDDIVRQIAQLGFNSVRLPWSNEMFETNPAVPDKAVAANPSLRGLRAMEVFDRVVHALTARGIMVILDNHNSNAEWCCGKDDNNLWYNQRYPETSWLRDWRDMATRYKDNPLVVGADLRNEPREGATWGGALSTNWQAAAERGGNEVLAANPNLLVIVEGVSYGGDLSGARSLPVQLNLPNHVVYSPHDYSFWYQHNIRTYQDWQKQIDPKWGYLVTGPNPQPVWLSEYGTCNTSPTCVGSTSPADSGAWFRQVTEFLKTNNVSWGYWPLNGTQSTGKERTWGAPDTYGILNTQWDGPASPELIQRLREIK